MRICDYGIEGGRAEHKNTRVFQSSVPRSQAIFAGRSQTMRSQIQVVIFYFRIFGGPDIHAYTHS
jgi:hypothetical protein